MTYFRALSRNLAGETEENHVNPVRMDPHIRTESSVTFDGFLVRILSGLGFLCPALNLAAVHHLPGVLIHTGSLPHHLYQSVHNPGNISMGPEGRGAARSHVDGNSTYEQ